MERLAALPDGAGLQVFWRAFKPEFAEEPRVIFEENRRVEGHALEGELKRLHADDPQSGQSVAFVSGLPTSELQWTAYRSWWSTHQLEKTKKGWHDRSEHALERLRALSDGAGVEEVWRALESPQRYAPTA